MRRTPQAKAVVTAVISVRRSPRLAKLRRVSARNERKSALAAASASPRRSARIAKLVAMAKSPQSVQSAAISSSPSRRGRSTPAAQTSVTATVIHTTIAPVNNANEREEIAIARLAREGCRNGEVQATLTWSDPADLDLHAYCACGAHIYYGSKECACGGWLDRDMNVSTTGPNSSLEPVENIFWASSPSGVYRITVNNFRNHVLPNSPFADPLRRVAFRVRLRRGGDNAGNEQWFEGTVGPNETVECFSWNNVGTGALGRMVLLQPLVGGGTFKDMCAAAGVTFTKGQGYYAVVRREDVSAKKDMMLHHIASDTFTIGATACRKKLNLPEDSDVKISPSDVPDGSACFDDGAHSGRSIAAPTKGWELTKRI
ncbi:hypothetical protein HDU82_007726 [Entophlyctis luteolus]|nr:hypothetical protein HDU82_007726 [Entophlyctis luteolus]